ncbi:sensor histidine kinase [Pseudomonas protegens]|uniref:histidine kinase n=2 Tax=Pseudomonas protegens TaxID=380021 RepID=Q4K7F1_PSEF5|nr:HAMP domain-containing sensor histidine kinase [Pseudomonas protegens]AAY93981.1 sensor histidine kinase [Pseudomonas protegens Pf-5]ASE21837.1 sensor histidine kinase [Pseudomonas protegens]QEZ54477.1 sensor histidine kinase [Pseudomonas protegens]QEZ59319.1 sensor histidine kinase [Pseudomonas protegens]QEZ65766.1 sensor histidine kinase [Pseudomonas protegens]
MRLANFILIHMESILLEWERFARSIETPYPTQDVHGLRNQASRILNCIAHDMLTPQSDAQQFEKSQGRGPVADADKVAQNHAQARWSAGFTLNQMVAEYRALRASVLRLWLSSEPEIKATHTDDMLRFNEAIDQALTGSIVSFEVVLEQTRKLFLGILGHDLRSPLGAALMGSDLLARSVTDRRQKNLAQQVGTSVRRANRIVDDLLQLARSNLGEGIQIRKEPVELNTLCSQIVEEVRAYYPGVRVLFEEGEVLNGLFDPERMGQVLANLLGNAVQHGDVRKPIEVRLTRNPSETCFEVHNYGKPIATEAMPLLFSAGGSGYERGASSGLGLGLFIAAQIVAGHGGEIQVQSTKEAGTTFRVRIPATSE